MDQSKDSHSYKKKLEYNRDYCRENYRSFSVRYSVEKENEIIEWLESKKFYKSYISELIVADMKKNQKDKKEKKEKKDKKDKKAKK